MELKPFLETIATDLLQRFSNLECKWIKGRQNYLVAQVSIV